MKTIKDLNKKIEEELDGAECYVYLANKYKEENPKLAEVFNNIATQEMKHVDMLHAEIVRAITEYQAKNGDPPPAMKAIYDYLHERMIDRVSSIRMKKE